MHHRSAEIFIDYYVKPIFNWTAFDVSEGIPYLNFNDCESYIYAGLLKLVLIYHRASLVAIC